MAIAGIERPLAKASGLPGKIMDRDEISPAPDVSEYIRNR
jgi:hypothetical protein